MPSPPAAWAGGRRGRQRFKGRASAFQHPKVKGFDAVGIGEQVDGCDLSVGDGEPEDHPSPSALGPDRPGRTVDESESCRPGASGEGLRDSGCAEYLLHAAPAGDRSRQRQIVDAFLAASRGGDFDTLLAMLDPDVVLRSDTAAVKMGR